MSARTVVEHALRVYYADSRDPKGVVTKLLAMYDDENGHELAEKQRREMRTPGDSYDASRWNRVIDEVADCIDPEVLNSG